MAATAKTTLKTISLGYAAVGNSLLGSPSTYTSVTGVLKGLTIAQDSPDETEIKAQFSDSPFDVLYTGKPITIKFELANYKLSDLTPLFGGTYTAASASADESYEGPTAAYTSEHEFKLGFQKGNRFLLIYRGNTVGTVKKDDDGALNFSVIITSLVYNDGTTDHMYQIIGDAKTA